MRPRSKPFSERAAFFDLLSEFICCKFPVTRFGSGLHNCSKPPLARHIAWIKDVASPNMTLAKETSRGKGLIIGQSPSAAQSTNAFYSSNNRLRL